MARQTQSTERPEKKQGRRDPTASGERDASVNRAASHNYFLIEKFEAGIALRGTEVKSIRAGRANLKDAYGLVKDGELWLINAHIGPYEHGNIFNHEPLRTRKLLVHKNELHKLFGKTQQQGLDPYPHPALLPQRQGQSRDGPCERQADLGQARNRAPQGRRQRSP